ncbi:hypothetical protein SKAU_G00324790 [Synaphobranchus kaupii]|uniref:Uncharacterized protein n=1 Tax=Synaphobranchus kaupii TaxID=118154 RepID=A0A9Q1EPE5_SYNKA|nr:hypothetical protein SKAU_G00324790 [Synaphobranchus kaupii]
MLNRKTDSCILQSPPTLGREFLAGWPVTGVELGERSTDAERVSTSLYFPLFLKGLLLGKQSRLCSYCTSVGHT